MPSFRSIHILVCQIESLIDKCKNDLTLDFLLIYEHVIFYLYKTQVESRQTRVVCEWCEMLGYAQGSEKGLVRYGFEKSRLAKTKDKPNKDQISRPKPQAKDQDQSQSQSQTKVKIKDQSQTTKTKDKG